jgi:hypothetical protein
MPAPAPQLELDDRTNALLDAESETVRTRIKDVMSRYKDKTGFDCNHVATTILAALAEFEVSVEDKELILTNSAELAVGVAPCIRQRFPQLASFEHVAQLVQGYYCDDVTRIEDRNGTAIRPHSIVMARIKGIDVLVRIQRVYHDGRVMVMAQLLSSKDVEVVTRKNYLDLLKLVLLQQEHAPRGEEITEAKNLCLLAVRDADNFKVGGICAQAETNALPQRQRRTRVNLNSETEEEVIDAMRAYDPKVTREWAEDKEWTKGQQKVIRKRRQRNHHHHHSVRTAAGALLNLFDQEAA